MPESADFSDSLTKKKKKIISLCHKSHGIEFTPLTISQDTV